MTSFMKGGVLFEGEHLGALQSQPGFGAFSLSYNGKLAGRCSNEIKIAVCKVDVALDDAHAGDPGGRVVLGPVRVETVDAL